MNFQCRIQRTQKHNVWNTKKRKKQLKNRRHGFFSTLHYNMMKSKITRKSNRLLKLGFYFGQKMTQTSWKFTQLDKMSKLWCIYQFIILILYFHIEKVFMLPIKTLTLDYDLRESFLRPKQKVEKVWLNNQEGVCGKRDVQI